MKRIILPHWVHSALDIGPAVCFLTALLVTHDILWATWFLFGGAILSLTVSLGFERRLRPLPSITAVLALIFGGATLLFHNPVFVQIKLTIVDTTLALIILGAIYTGRVPLKMALGHIIAMEDKQWNVLAFRYALYCLACAATNEFVRRTQTTEVWGWFRVSASAGNVVFVALHLPFLFKHGREVAKTEG